MYTYLHVPVLVPLLTAVGLCFVRVRALHEWQRHPSGSRPLRRRLPAEVRPPPSPILPPSISRYGNASRDRFPAATRATFRRTRSAPSARTALRATLSTPPATERTNSAMYLYYFSLSLSLSLATYISLFTSLSMRDIVESRSMRAKGRGPGATDFESTEIIGTNQFRMALELYQSATIEITVPLFLSPSLRLIPCYLCISVAVTPSLTVVIGTDIVGAHVGEYGEHDRRREVDPLGTNRDHLPRGPGRRVRRRENKNNIRKYPQYPDISVNNLEFSGKWLSSLQVRRRYHGRTGSIRLQTGTNILSLFSYSLSFSRKEEVTRCRDRTARATTPSGTSS